MGYQESQAALRFGIVNVEVELVGVNHREPATVEVQMWGLPQRRLRCLRTLGIWWGLALVSIAVPILHFILVPLFLLIGLVAAPVAMQRKSMVLGGKGRCPFCAEPFVIVAHPDRWPLRDICTACHRHVSIERRDSK